MKTNITEHKVDKISSCCQRVLCLVLSIIMLGNLSVEAAGISNISSSQIRTRVAETIDQFSPTKSPEQFLNDVKEEMEKLFSEEAPAEEVPTKLSMQEYSIAYTKEINNFYKQQADTLERRVQKALQNFDQEAQTAWQEAQQEFDNNKANMTPEELAMAENELKRYQKYLEDEKRSYEATVAQQQAQFQQQLDDEQIAYINNIPQVYAEYSNSFDAALKDMEDAQVEFYKELISQIILNYQRTRDNQSKENFVTLMTFLSSFEQRDKFFTRGDREFALRELAKNFNGIAAACGGSVVITYDPSGTWGSAAIGGSPSAGRMYDVQTNRQHEFKLDNENQCNLAISSLIPFGNLNGNAYEITKFMSGYFEQPMFGQILLVGAKALTLTKNHNMEAFSQFIDQAIEKENVEARGTFWSRLDMATGEGIAKSVFTDFNGKYTSHNVSSSAKRGPGEPNVWEDVAQLLAQYNTPQSDAILKKAVDQCSLKRVGNYPNVKQRFECKGIYPFLFGVITQKPEMAQHLFTLPLVNDQPGQEMDGNGRIHQVTPQEAQSRHQYRVHNDATLKFTKGELLARFFYDQFFEDLYPVDKQRMDSILAGNAVLNPKKTMTPYLTNSERFAKLQRKYNINQVVIGVGSMVDFIITILLIRDVGLFAFRIGAVAKNLSNALKIRKVIMEYRALPNTLSKSLKIAHGLQARGITVAQLQKHHAFLTKVNNLKNGVRQIPQVRTKIITHFTQGRVSPISESPARNLRQGRPGYHHRQSGLQGGRRVKFGPEVPLGEPGAYANAAFAGAGLTPKLSPWQQVRAAFNNSLFADAWRWLTPKVKASTKEATFFDAGKIRFKYTDVKGNPITVTEVKIQDGILYINGEMAKTYKAYLSLEDLESLAALASQEGVALGFNGMWIKLVSNSNKTTEWERLVSLSRQVTTVPLYNADGLKILEVGLNSGFKLEKSLLDRIGRGAKLVFKDGKIHLLENGVWEVLSQFDMISIPKTAINNMVKGKNIDFLTKLFSGPSIDAPWSLSLQQTKSKLFWPMAVNMLSYSAASSSLMMTLEKEPFNLSSSTSILVGLALPYASGFLAPYLMPLVKRFGARNVMVTSLLMATGALGVATFSGYHGTASYEKDYNGDVMIDEEGHAIIRKDKPAVWPLIMTAALTGLASTGIRATSNVVLKAYELNQSTMNLSMLFKSVGGSAFTFVPWVYALGNKDRDFSVTYPWLAGLSLVTAGGLLATMPKMSTFGYKAINRADFHSPWGLFKKRTVWPYVGGIALMSSLEGYVYFKGLNSFSRDVFGQKDGDNGVLREGEADNFFERMIDKNPANAKFFSSLVTAIPQIVLRKWSPRRAYFGRGMLNSALLAGAGTLMLMQPTENSSVGANIALGAASGLAIGFGTAQVFQYNQKLMTAAVKATYGEKFVPTAIVLHSMGNVGFVLPSFFGKEAQRRKDLYGENDFFSTQRTFQLPLTSYTLGLGLIFMAEHRLLPRAHRLAPISRWIGIGTTSLLGGSNLVTGGLYTIPPVMLPTMDAAAGAEEVTMPPLTSPNFKIQATPNLRLQSGYSLGPQVKFSTQPTKK